MRDFDRANDLLTIENHELRTANARLLVRINALRAVLQALHDHDVEYARINNLHNADGTPATFHELLQARAALEPKP